MIPKKIFFKLIDAAVIHSISLVKHLWKYEWVQTPEVTKHNLMAKIQCRDTTLPLLGGRDAGLFHYYVWRLGTLKSSSESLDKISASSVLSG